MRNPVTEFGAVGNGTTDDTAAIQAALNTGDSVQLPRGKFKLTAPLVFKTHGQMLIGENKGPSGSVLYPVGSLPAVRFSGSFLFNTMQDLRIEAADCTGNALEVVGAVGNAAERHYIRDIMINSPWVGAYVRRFNTLTFENVNIQGVRGPRGFVADCSGTSKDARRGDLLRLKTVSVSIHNAGTAFYFDGDIGGIQMESTSTVGPNIGYHFANSSNLTGGNVIAFLQAYDIQCDFPVTNAMKIDALEGGTFTSCYFFGATTNHLVDAVASDPQLIKRIKFVSSKVSGGAYCNINFKGRDLEVVSCEVTEQTPIRNAEGVMINKGQYPSIALLAGTGRGTFLGGIYGDLNSTTQIRNYGIWRENTTIGVFPAAITGYGINGLSNF
ncbi:glycosyl hydrolase family 28-related protein [Roseomonas sp. 18066]|uniref:glycosyl hydrolase family 28-related protein n=1 Tax=Roseomonas sp. 18066 TaxID=2681412 RepID=UPI0013589EEA|nr:glycosyl hydrolase family 28-related protein [Roseomonas sp. 18066]